MDPALLERAITPRTKAIIPVHIFGQTADMDPILEIARKHGIPVVEDACQAHGAEYKNRKAGSMGVAGCFSFYPGKNLGALGEAGAVVTNSKELKEKIQMLRDHGQAKKYYHALIGWNGRMDGIQGALLRVKLRHLASGNERRRSHARLYNEQFASLAGVTIPRTAKHAVPVYHIYAVRVKNRDAVLKALTSQGIGCGVHYPIPLHLQEAYAGLGYGVKSFPVAEQCAGEFLSLPMYPELTPEQIAMVVEGLKKASVACSSEKGGAA
jgi:dTDP-4-amino-4,6-dideoxygalactose transaminase